MTSNSPPDANNRVTGAQESDALTANQKLWQAMNPVNGQIYAAIAIAVVSSLAGVGSIASLVMILGALFKDENPWPWVLVSGVLTLIMLLTRLWSFSVSHIAAFKLEVILRTELARKLTRLPLGDVMARGSGRLTKVMDQDVLSLHGFVADTTPMYGRAFAAPMVTLVLALWIDWRYTLVALAVFIIGVLMMMFSMKGHQAMQAEYFKANEELNNRVVEFIRSMPIIRTFDSGSASFSRFSQALSSFRQLLTDWLDAVANNAVWAMLVLAPLPTLTALVIAGVLIMEPSLQDLPGWIGLLLLGAGFAESIMPLMWMNMFIRKAELGAERIHELLNAPELSRSSQVEQPKDASVVFRQVSFRYETRTDNALTDVSFTVPQGSVTALVGPSGAGKTSVARLIPRFWDATGGHILIGGVDVKDIAADTLIKQVAFVFQDTFLFNDSIANNIAMAKPDATQEDIESAAKAAFAHNFISALPDGYDTLASERGLNLSGGQRQRITLARAILQDCPILVLDEATAFADPESEEKILLALSNLMRGKTVIMIAHRLATIQGADQILVFDQGRLHSSGTHDELIAQQSIYARLWSHYQQAQQWHVNKQGTESHSQITTEAP